MPSQLTGFIAAISASIFFGSNYVPIKKYPTYDGFLFQWYQCSGILFVGLMVALCTNEWSEMAEKGFWVGWEGLLGGAIWCFGNILAAPVLKVLGLGVGFVMWNGSNTIMGWALGRFGLFGTTAEHFTHPLCNILGLACIILSLFLMLFVKPKITKAEKIPAMEHRQSFSLSLSRTNTLSDSLTNVSARAANAMEADELTELNEPRRPRRIRSTTNVCANSLDFSGLAEEIAAMEYENNIQDDVNSSTYADNSFYEGDSYAQLGSGVDSDGQLPEEIETSKVATGFVKYAAIGAALFMGCLVGNSLTPYVVWKSQRADLGLTVHPLDFVFSQCVGIYMSSTIVFVLQGLQVSIRKRPFYKVAVRPAFISGVLWALGLVSQLIAATELPYAVAYPLCAIGPVFVSTIWSVCVYKELDGQGNRNYKFLTLALSTMIVGIFLMAYSTL